MHQDADLIVERSPKQRFIRVLSSQFNEQIGKGTYKTVYRGYDEESGCEIAWNVIHLEQLPQQERKRLSEELSILSNIMHPNIISFINAWVSKTRSEVVFITEIIHGGSLKKHLRRIQRPRLKILKHWCREILKGLVYLHSIKPYPVIHRDIKCDNIFINTHNNQIRIGDLGLAIKLKEQGYTQSVLGTPEFMAPEIYGENYGTPVDIYAFGMTCLEMATQRRPYEECSTPQQIYQKVTQGIKPRAIDFIMNKDLKEFILKCLEEQDKRPTATDLLNDKFLSAESEDDNSHVQLLEELKEQKIKIKEHIDLDKSILVQLFEGDEYWIKIQFSDRQCYNLKFVDHLNQILGTEKEKANIEQEILKLDGVEAIKWVTQQAECKYLIQKQLLKTLEYYHNQTHQLCLGMTSAQLEELELECLRGFQVQRANGSKK